MAPDSTSDEVPDAGAAAEIEHFRPIGTIFILACFVVVLVLLWASVYLILIDRGVTV